MSLIAKNPWLSIPLLTVAAVVGLYGFLRWFEYKQVYHPTRSWDGDGSLLGVAWEDVKFSTSDGVELSGWYFPYTKGGVSAPRVALVCHGNGGNISHRLDLYRILMDAGLSVFAFDYRGYGRSQGRPGEAGTYLDAEAAHRWLLTRGYGSDQVIAYGESLGGGVAAELALRLPVAGLILQSTFVSVPELGAELFPWLPVRTISTIRYDTGSKLPRIRVPLLILHSQVDTLVIFRHAQRNLTVANHPKMLCEIYGDHNDALETDPQALVKGVRKFLESLPKPAVPERAK